MDRQLEAFAEFDNEVVHRPGKQHQNADALSRKMCKQCGTQVGGEEITLEAQMYAPLQAVVVSPEYESLSIKVGSEDVNCPHQSLDELHNTFSHSWRGPYLHRTPCTHEHCSKPFPIIASVSTINPRLKFGNGSIGVDNSLLQFKDASLHIWVHSHSLPFCGRACVQRGNICAKLLICSLWLKYNYIIKINQACDPMETS